MSTGLVQVPDCTNPPRPWWETSGMLPATWSLGVLVTLAIIGIVLLWINDH